VTRIVLRVLSWLILAYRRWLSGRGPLRGVRCSFAAEESCSAFGLRATREAPTARAALARIVRRLGRCRDACLLGDGTAVSWAPLHDRAPAEIIVEMQRDGEHPPAIARMLATRRTVASWRGDTAALRELADSARRPAPIYSHQATARRSRSRIVRALMLAVAAAGMSMFHPWLGGVTLALAAIAAASTLRTQIGRNRRFDLHAAWAKLRIRGQGQNEPGRTSAGGRVSLAVS
jgi:putative component of membrane protein insertase Oxa1/YidC/SpoIIIJ protein YidD